MAPTFARRATAVAAVAAMLGLTLAACSGGQAPTDPNTVTIMAPYFNASPPASDGAVQKKLDEMTGKTVKITWAPNASYEDKTNITLASSDVPEVMVIQGKTDIPPGRRNPPPGPDPTIPPDPLTPPGPTPPLGPTPPVQPIP